MLASVTFPEALCSGVGRTSWPSGNPHYILSRLLSGPTPAAGCVADPPAACVSLAEGGGSAVCGTGDGHLGEGPGWDLWV